MPLRGNLDGLTHNRIAGWAWDPDTPDQPVSLILSCDDRILGRVLADRYRADLERAGIGKGRHGFAFQLASPLSPLARHSVAARREEDGTHLRGSPRTLEPASSFDRETRTAMAQILSTFADQGDLERRLAFLADQADRLRQLHADAQSGANERHSRRRLMGSPSAATTVKPRALVIDERVPLPGNDAGSNAVLSHMRSLQRLGYDVTFAPANLRGDGAMLETEGITCCLHPWYASIEEVLRRQRGAFALVYLHRVAAASRYGVLARDQQSKARIVYSVADLHHLRFARQAEVEQRPELTRISERLRLTELAAAWQSDAVITHSTAEAAVLRRHMRPEKIHVVPWSLTPRPTAVPFVERHGVAFIGSYGHQPNVDAAHWLVDHVMPELDAQGSTITCSLIGSNMPDSLRNLSRPNVDPVGHVADLAAVFDRVRVTVAPLAYGAGVKGKVLDSLAAGIPCICTPAAAEGLDLPDILLEHVASTPADLARTMRAMHEDEALNRACREAGLAYITTMANEDRIDLLMGDAVRRPKVSPGRL